MNTNQVVLTGSISKAELKEYHGRAVANASLLFANGKGTAQLNVSAWGQLAEQLANLTDGTAVTVKGRTAASFFTTKTGRKATITQGFYSRAGKVFVSQQTKHLLTQRINTFLAQGVTGISQASANIFTCQTWIIFEDVRL